ncbi:phosphoglucosamine mutase [Methylophilaceae bacterium]|jgi:phosphoglucosamine mutase|nr:phosphoglucosamine mutase [Methylophilaceae bacterium]
MTRKYFGTDGIRGKTGEYPITPEFFIKLGYAAGIVLTKSWNKEERPTVVIGKDTRISGYMLESALESGFSSAGVDVFLTGPIPTPAIAFLTKSLGAQIGVVISASHNSFEDNGIKFFSDLGLKLSDEVELEIEALLDKEVNRNPSNKIGKVRRIDDAVDRYVDFCKSTVDSSFNLNSLKIVLDCAHGATYQVAPKVFSALGAEVVTINNKPDGLNINHNAGSVHPELLQESVLSNNADLGIAFDGDGDRVIMTDSKGNLVDGDQLLFLIMQHYHKKDKLKGGVIGTLMTNLAFEEQCKKLKIPFLRSNVGDRYVSELLYEKNWMLGGENSGHILITNKHSTGDGIISALQVLEAIITLKKPIDVALKSMPMYPQILINLPITKKVDLKSLLMERAISDAKLIMENKGRILIRESGTQPLIRVMTEGPDKEKAIKAAEFLIEKIKS